MPTKILVVDDEPDLRDLMERRFRREIRRDEFQFAFAGDGVDALAMVEDDAGIELVITDINMPRMDGLSLLDHLGGYEDRLKAIVISAYDDMGNIRMAMNRGAFDFVTKPIDFQDLLITVKKALDQLDLLKEAIERRVLADRAKANLARYFPPTLVDGLAARDEPFGPPRQQAIAVLFADIRGFTTMSEQMSPAAVMEMLRVFHDRMERTVFDHGGVLDSYIADAVLATFGVPEPGPADAANALACARAMLARLDDWNRDRATASEPPIGIGVGVHYGPAVLGDIGSERSMTFGVIGDTVNTASRLQSLTRNLNTDLIVSEDLVAQIRLERGADAPIALSGLAPRGPQALRGRTTDIAIHVLDHSRPD